MANVLFYNRDTGSGAIGELTSTSFTNTKSFGHDAFGRNWTHVETTPRGILFYNADTGQAAIGSISAGDFTTNETFGARFFSPGWTHVHDIGVYGYVLFYRASTGEGALVSGFSAAGAAIQTIKPFPVDSFAHGWTHIVRCTGYPGHLYFYNGATGEAAAAVLVDKTPPGGEPRLGVPNDLVTGQRFPVGLFSRNWSSVLPLAGKDRVFGNWPLDYQLLFYNERTGAAAITTLVGQFTVGTGITFAAGDFSQGWTHMVQAGGPALFYNAATGAAAVGFHPSAKYIPPGVLSAGWTSIVAQDAELPPVH